MGTLAAYILWACAGTHKVCFADFFQRYPHRHRYRLQVHAYKRVAYIHPCLRRKLLHGNRVIKSVVGRCCKRSARLRLRDNVYNGNAVFLRRFALYNQRPVKVLAALGGKIYPLFFSSG